jgi:phenylacetate-CoA ligase
MPEVVVPKSSMIGVRWPAFPEPKSARLLSLAFQLERSQWWSPQDILRMQLAQISELLRHADRTVPRYRQAFARVGLRPDRGPLSLEQFREIPLLERPEVQKLGERLRASDVPPGHGRAWAVSTSGSTGRAVQTMQTDATRAVWSALTLREHLWHRRDFAAKLSAIRFTKDEAAAPPHGKQIPSWGPPTNAMIETGPSSMLWLRASHAEQKEWLLREDPTYLLTYPTNLDCLAREFEKDGAKLPSLRGIRTVSETVTEETRQAAREVFGVPLTDMYSSYEVGFIAMQCPEHEHYHVQSENVLVEILDEDERPCGPGEIGRVVLTHLQNFATPLIRYDVGDYAEVGELCPCGRGLPVLRRIVGRTRNMLHRPDGSTYWPTTGSKSCRKVAPVSQVQMVQTSLETIEVRIVPEGPITEEHERELMAVFRRVLGYPFEVKLVYVDEIPRSKSGKYEEFLSLISPPRQDPVQEGRGA